jgi:hypothetical protein
LAGLAIALASLLCSRATNSNAAVAFTAGLEISSPADFYSPLAPYGVWETVVPYGRCWHPFDVRTDWRPYGTGYWEWTDCGWYWVSDEPWAWACYHYGSWVYDSFYGWVWVPATEWAPAWVVWRESPDYIGWAPCGPAGYVAPASMFLFVDAHHFHDPIRPGVFIVNNPTIMNRTRVVNNITRTTRSFDGVSRRVVVNTGPDPSLIQRATGTRLTTRPIREVVSHTPAPAAVPRTRSGPEYDRPVQPIPRSSTVYHAPRSSPAQTPATATPAQPAPRRERETTSPATTGREVPRVYQQQPAPRTAPQPGLQRAPTVPQKEVSPNSPRAIPPTGREVPRNYPETPPAIAPTPPRNEVVPRREPVPPNAAQPVPPQRPVVPPGQDRHDDRDRDH